MGIPNYDRSLRILKPTSAIRPAVFMIAHRTIRLVHRVIPITLAILSTVLSGETIGADTANSIRARGTYEVVRDVPYANVDGETLAANVFIPEGAGPFPGVLLIHGGGWAFGSKLEMEGVAARLARRGFVAASVDYRLAPKHLFPAQLDDCREALKWFHKESEKYHADPNWLSIYGYSAGGHLALLLALAEWPADAGTAIRPQAVVAGGAPTDFRDLPQQTPILSFWLGGTRQEKPALYRDASPAAFARGDAPPIYFYHGEADRLVSVSQCRRMAELLQSHDAVVEVDTIPDRGHVATFLDGRATERAIDFLQRRKENRGKQAGSVKSATEHPND